MPVAPETINAVAEAIEVRRALALRQFDIAADRLDEIRARLRFAVEETDATAAAIRQMSEAAADAIVSFRGMVTLADDLRKLISIPTETPAAPIDRDGRLEALRARIVSEVEGASVDLGTLGTILRDETAGTGDDVLRLAASIRGHHDNLQATLSEAIEVSSCSGSA